MVWVNIIFVLCVFEAAIASAGTITIRENTILSEPKAFIQLSDIAQFENIDSGLVETLSRIKISDTPKDNEKRIFTRYAISEVLRQSVQLTKLKSVIPQKVQLISRFNPLHEDRLKIALVKYYQTLTSAQIEPESLKVNEVFTEPIVSIKIGFKSELPKGSFSLPVDVQTAKEVHHVWLTGILKVWQTVPVVKRSISVGERIGADDVTFEKRDITFATDAIADAKDFTSATAGKVLTAGTVVWKGALLRSRALKSGDAVKLILGTDTWQVTATGVAQQSGFIGDTVNVLNPSTQRSVSGLVIDKGVVRVQ